MTAYRERDYAAVSQYLNEDVGSPTCTSKKRRDASDPRFKRVIQSENAADACHGPAPRQFPYTLEDQALTDRVVSYLKSPQEPTPFSESFRNFDEPKATCEGEDPSPEVTKDVGLESSPPRLGGHDRSPEMMMMSCLKTNLKRSASDCTLQKKSKFGEEKEEEVRAYPSATRLTRVHNWIKEYKALPEKRRSVVTVIGQTQTKPFSKVLNEINQRRKLAKELDRHALCEAILGTRERAAEVKNLVAKVDLVLPDGKVIYSAEKVYVHREGRTCSEKDWEESAKTSRDAEENPDHLRKRCDMIPERDSTPSQVGRKSRTKRSSKKSATNKEKVLLEEKMGSLRGRISGRILWAVLLLLCLAVSACAGFYTLKPQESYRLSGLFRAKTVTWYEKLLL